jgi:hypothetical protein
MVLESYAVAATNATAGTTISSSPFTGDKLTENTQGSSTADEAWRRERSIRIEAQHRRR